MALVELLASDRIIWLTFVPALSGSALARMLSASPDAYWDTGLQKIEPLQLRSPHDWHRTRLGTCHYRPPLGTAAYDFEAFADIQAFARRLAADAGEVEVAERHLTDGRRFVQTTHVPAARIQEIFPRCAVVSLIESPPLAFGLRAYHEKFNRYIWPMSLQRALWDGMPLEEALRKCPEKVVLHEGVPLTGLQVHTGRLDPTPADIRRLYCRLHAAMQAQIAAVAEGPATIRVSRERLFALDTFAEEYGTLCATLGIVPATEEVSRFVTEYNATQWRRPAPAEAA